MKRNRAYRRYEREKHIERKERILKEYRADNMPSQYDSQDIWATVRLREPIDFSIGYCNPFWYTAYRGTLSKGKIHCSCPMCRCKSKNKGHRKSYAPSYNPSPKDKRRLEEMLYEIEEFC